MSTGYFVYGSSIYGNHDADSDIDIAVYGCFEKIFDDGSLIYENYEDFKKSVMLCEPVSLEGYSLQFHRDFRDCWFYAPFEERIDLSILRTSISSKASNSFVKAKKKILIEKDFDIRSSMKSLFHSIRLLDFGRQMAYYGYIKDFSSCEEVWNKILKTYSTNDEEKILEEIKKEYKPLYNEYASKFKKLAPKRT